MNDFLNVTKKLKYWQKIVKEYMLRQIAGKTKQLFGSGEIRTRASEETGALNQRLRPLGHATLLMHDTLKIR